MLDRNLKEKLIERVKEAKMQDMSLWFDADCLIHELGIGELEDDEAEQKVANLEDRIGHEDLLEDGPGYIYP